MPEFHLGKAQLFQNYFSCVWTAAYGFLSCQQKPKLSLNWVVSVPDWRYIMWVMMVYKVWIHLSGFQLTHILFSHSNNTNYLYPNDKYFPCIFYTNIPEQHKCYRWRPLAILCVLDVQSSYLWGILYPLNDSYDSWSFEWHLVFQLTIVILHGGWCLYAWYSGEEFSTQVYPIILFWNSPFYARNLCCHNHSIDVV